MKSRFLLATALVLSLAACGDGSPSASDAETALNKFMAEFWGGLGNQHPAHLMVKDLKCSKVGDGIYNCLMLFTSPTMGGQVGQDRYQFTMLGGEWRATRIN